jgi:hypothetical protein
MPTDPPPIPPELREGAPLPEPTTVWTPRAERRRVAAGGSFDPLLRIGAISLNFAYSAAGLALLGWGIDYLAGSFPVGLLVGAGLGVAAGAYQFVRQANAMNRRDAAAHKGTYTRPAAPGGDRDRVPDADRR